MNIVIKNQGFRILDSLNTEVIKTLTGEFSREEVQEQLINLYYNKAIVDITAIRNYYDANSVVAFLRAFEPTKVVLLLNDSEVINSGSFLGILVDNGIYNFTRNAAGVTYLLDNPNTYEAVAQYTRKDYGLNSTMQAAPTLGMPDANFAPPPMVQQNQFIAEEMMPSQPIQEDTSSKKALRGQKIIGVQNLTKHAGATTLAYLMINQLKTNYNVRGIEMNKQDFIYFRDSDLSMCTSIDDFKLKLKEYANAEVIIVDLNDFDASEFCDDILYLVDPGRLSINKLMKKDSNVATKVRKGKVILNRSSVKHIEMPDFEHETKFSVFFNMPNLNDREERIQMVDALLYNLGFKKQNPGNMGLFGNIFQKK